jgi:serine/threonine protein kinase
VNERLTSALADRYRIERELGAGGMATVYLAQDLRHDRKVATKVLKPDGYIYYDARLEGDGHYDVSPDGKRFVLARRGGTHHIVVMQNVHELARRLARGGGTVP